MAGRRRGGCRGGGDWREKGPGLRRSGGRMAAQRWVERTGWTVKTQAKWPGGGWLGPGS